MVRRWLVLVALAVFVSDGSAQTLGRVRSLARVRIPGNTADVANSGDAGWQAAMVAKVQTILATPNGYTKTTGKTCHLGDSMTLSAAYGDWTSNQGTQATAPGASASDQATINWAHWNQWDTDDGFYLAGGIGFTAYSGTGWADAWTPILDDSRVTACQFIIWMLNDPSGSPGTPDLTIVQTRIDQSIARGIVPILSSVPPRWAAASPSYDNDYTLPYNAALKAKAEANALPYIAFYEEIVRRRPNAAGNITPGAWFGTLIDAGDGVHPGLSSDYTIADIGTSPYANGGDAATHTTGALLLNSGYDLRTWLAVQKMKQIKALAGL